MDTGKNNQKTSTPFGNGPALEPSSPPVFRVRAGAANFVDKTMYEITDFMRRAAQPHKGSRYPAVIEKLHNGKYGCRCGAVPAELEGKEYETPGACLAAVLGSEAIKTGEILRIQELCDGRNVMWEPRSDGQFVPHDNSRKTG